MGEGERCILGFGGETQEGKRLLGRPWGRLEDSIKMDLQEVGEWTGLSWLRIGTGGRHV
jgi:hypothetical protein